MTRHLLKRIAGVALAATLAACAHNVPPVEESAVVTRSHGMQAKPAAPARAIPETHRVERGETLFSIAFRYGLDFRALAANNRIAEPYTIYPGQKLRLRPGKASAPATTASAAKPGAELRKPVAAPSTAPATTPATTPATPAPATKGPSGNWMWPVQGKVTSGFNANVVGPKGIAIGGNTGDPVYAARDGRVVYTGSSLVGYGQLVIIKHDDIYLSAYAHNSKLLVKEGDAVHAGDEIAEMGSSGTDRTQLHFEVRRNGDPIDPLSVLPRL